MAIGPIFDKEQNRLKEAQLIGEIGSQAMDIARTRGEIEATRAGKAELAAKGITQPDKNVTREQWDAWNAQLVATDGYKTAQAQWGTGSAIQQGLQAATAALQGLAGGNLAQALTGASAPYLATVIKQYVGEDNVAASAMAHAVLGAVVAEASGNSALAGGAGAAGGELAANYLASTLYPGVKPAVR